MKCCKKWLALSLAAMLCMGVLAGCMSRSNDSSSSTASPTSSAPSTSSMPGNASVPPVSSLPSVASDSSSMASEPILSSEPVPAAPTGSTDFSQIGALDGKAVLWGPGRNFDDSNRPTACIDLQTQYLKYGSLFIGDKQAKTVYLTFDQGYENGYTAAILDTLKEKNVQAVFFLTGHYVNTAPELVQRMKDEGHVLGNHSNRHYDATEVPLAQMQQDLDELRAMVQEQFDYDCKLYRFPEGKFSEQTLALVQRSGDVPVFWSFAYADWNPDKQLAQEDALAQLTGRLHNGAIYLLHSVSSTNAAVLGRFIDAAREQGYTLSPVDA